LSFVLDGSVALAWCFDDEATPAVDDAMLEAGAAGAWVPPLWRWEVANGLLLGTRRGRMTEAKREASIDLLQAMAVRIDPDCDAHAWSDTVRLAEKHALTAYDASYLELALRRRLPLATLDAALARAARAEGVALVL
jgi:predicted nucleic acid-binding protein